ncbi:hypothetical protein SKAU_G00063580 [Synaphobranchus kaupii]|uniref:DDE Tnp4 domain-containing protein n=1 Tax=Synaphobranchus kaupii TaxID=118154 RepID=A0A9Q1G655_SYNKA|nr:hypothetical protein SKAU_G00063580 [Synaphobranchus kaupii]
MVGTLLARVTLDLLIETLEEDNTLGWGKTLEVLVFLYWLASATSYRVISEAFGIPRRSPAFRRTARSINGCHIRVVPAAVESQDYLNRKLFYSVQMQTICDHRGTFLNVFNWLPWYPPQGWFLIRDGGYPCIQDPITLITPYREPVQGAVQARYNSQLSKARGVVERAFWVMKMRWRSIFLKALKVQIPFAIEVIDCCAVLHNLFIKNNDLLDPAADDDDDDASESHSDE